MELKYEVEKLEYRIQSVRDLVDDQRSMLNAACDEINVLHKRIDDLEKLTKERTANTSKQFARVDELLNAIGDKLYPTFYKVFPGMIAAEDALERAIKQSGKDPKTST